MSWKMIHPDPIIPRSIYISKVYLHFPRVTRLDLIDLAGNRKRREEQEEEIREEEEEEEGEGLEKGVLPATVPI